MSCECHVPSTFDVVRSTQLWIFTCSIGVSPSIHINEPVKFAKLSITLPRFARWCWDLISCCNMGRSMSPNCWNSLPVKSEIADSPQIFNIWIAITQQRIDWFRSNLVHSLITLQLTQRFKVKVSKVKVTAWCNVLTVKRIRTDKLTGFNTWWKSSQYGAQYATLCSRSLGKINMAHCRSVHWKEKKTPENSLSAKLLPCFRRLGLLCSDVRISTGSSEIAVSAHAQSEYVQNTGKIIQWSKYPNLRGNCGRCCGSVEYWCILGHVKLKSGTTGATSSGLQVAMLRCPPFLVFTARPHCSQCRALY